MAYGQTGSGKTHTMFGPPGCLTEASVAAHRRSCGGVDDGSAPESWGLFPRAALSLLDANDGTVLYASAIEV